MIKSLEGLRTKVLTSPLMAALLFGAFLRPNSIAEFGAIPIRIMVVWKALAMLVIAACFLTKPKLSPVTVLIGVFQVLEAVCTLRFYDVSYLNGWLFDSASIAMLCLLVEQYADGSPKAMVQGITYVMGVFCLANLATVLIYPGGMRYPYESLDRIGVSDRYFMGLDNSHAFYIIPMLTTAILYAWNARWPFLAQAAMLAVLTASIYLTWSVSGVVAASAFIVLFLLSRVKKSYRLFNVCTFYAVIAAVFLVVVFLQATQWLAPLLENVLHKSVTMSSRTPMWAKAVALIKEKPLLGYGLMDKEAVWRLIDQVNCHNLFLQVLFNTGLVGLAVYAAILALLIRPLMRTVKTFGGYMLAVGLFSFLLVLEVESLVWPLQFYTVVLLCYHAEKIVAAMEPNALPGES